MGLDHILVYLIGILCGAIITLWWRQHKSTSGTLRIDHSNPEKDVYRFEIDTIEDLDQMSEIILSIDHNANLSQE